MMPPPTVLWMHAAAAEWVTKRSSTLMTTMHRPTRPSANREAVKRRQVKMDKVTVLIVWMAKEV